MCTRNLLPGARLVPAIALFAVLIATTAAVSTKSKRDGFAFQDGDVVFQGHMSGQGAAIAQATHSPYTHCGIVFLENGVPMVWEAVGPVKRTPWKEFMHHGEGDHYVIKRVRDPLASSEVSELKKAGTAMMGLPYDNHFQMDDERIYCSELVFKMFGAAGRSVGTLERFCDMDLEAPIAHRALVERFGGAVPCDSKVITPAALFRAAELVTVDSVGAPPRIP
ncbi:MAG: peptidoglycan peptidase [Flavobacteriales bacterium]|nr:peptidoglycan peptidase [Flavobacteriales bacterium]